MSHSFERYCKDYQNIENYEKAKADDFKGWHCHHRLETHNSDGERRDVDITQKELKALDMYYNRPASELIFLTSREHNAFKKGKYTGEKNSFYGKHHTEESKRKNVESHKGNKYRLGKHHTEESKRKNAEAHKGKHHSAETRKKLREAKKGNKYALGNTNTKGTHWYNNGKINKMAKECPEGFVPGILR